MNEQPPQPKQRTLSPALAFFSAFFGLGVGLVYVGELGLAIAAVFSVYGLIALSGWTGAMTSSVAGLGIVIILCLERWLRFFGQGCKWSSARAI